MNRLIASLFIFTFTSTHSFADEGKNQADSFANIYSSICIKNIADFNAVRKQLKPAPKLPPEKAKHFLNDQEGDAWPVPDKHGMFVLALPKNTNLCAVYAQRANTEEVKKLFITLIEKAPFPLTAKLISNKNIPSNANGLTNRINYEWSNQNVKRKILFTLTTAPIHNAKIQALATVSIIQE